MIIGYITTAGAAVTGSGGPAIAPLGFLIISFLMYDPVIARETAKNPQRIAPTRAAFQSEPGSVQSGRELLAVVQQSIDEGRVSQLVHSTYIIHPV